MCNNSIPGIYISDTKVDADVDTEVDAEKQEARCWAGFVVTVMARHPPMLSAWCRWCWPPTRAICTVPGMCAAHPRYLRGACGAQTISGDVAAIFHLPMLSAWCRWCLAPTYAICIVRAWTKICYAEPRTETQG
jgi:hypothetical protein